MPEATNMAELEQMIMKEVEVAMNELSKKAMENMKHETESYHDGCGHYMYGASTGNLASSPKVDPVQGSGSQRSFEFYLDTSLSYTAKNIELRKRHGWKSYFSTLEAYTAAETGTYHTTGRHGFWQRSKDLTELSMRIVFLYHFL